MKLNFDRYLFIYFFNYSNSKYFIFAKFLVLKVNFYHYLSLLLLNLDSNDPHFSKISFELCTLKRYFCFYSINPALISFRIEAVNICFFIDIMSFQMSFYRFHLIVAIVMNFKCIFRCFLINPVYLELKKSLRLLALKNRFCLNVFTITMGTVWTKILKPLLFDKEVLLVICVATMLEILL